jgi:hypothetical protein
MATPAVRMRISCKEASRTISQMQDGDIAFSVWLRLRAHLLLCVACLRFARQVRFLRVALRRYSR